MRSSDGVSKGREPVTDPFKTLGLSEEDLALCFGVSKEEVSSWRLHGVPESKRNTLDHLRVVAALLSKKLRTSRFPDLLRVPSPRFGGVSILEAFAKDPAATRERLESAFDFSATV